MTEYETLKEKYRKYIEIILDQNKQILIDSFCEYYGEKYRDLIKLRFNSIVFTFYYENNMASRIINHILNENLVSKMPDSFAKLNEFKTAYESSNHHNFDNVIMCSNPSIFENDNGFFLEATSSSNPQFTDAYINGEVERYIFVPLLYPEEYDIIHEINHAITRDILAQRESEFESVDKAGIEVIGDDTEKSEIDTEELFNDLAAKEITEIFHRRGGSFGKICSKGLISSPLDTNSYLVQEIYEAFKDNLKTARISDNKNAFVGRIGKENYFSLIHHVKALYLTNRNLVEEKRSENETYMKTLLANMLEYAAKENETNGTLEDYFSFLEKQGYKVTPLNDKQRR